MARFAANRLDHRHIYDLTQDLVAGRQGTDHPFILDGRDKRRIDCAGTPITYVRDSAAVVANRMERSMPRRHAFAVCRLALKAGARADRFVPTAAP